MVLEATYGWYWAADVLEEAGAEVHLAHPLGVKAFTYRRVKKMSATPRTWPTCCGWAGCRRRGSRRRRSGSCASSPATGTSWSGSAPRAGTRCTPCWPSSASRSPARTSSACSGQAWLDGLRLPQPYAGKVASLRQLNGELTGEITLLEQVIGDLLAGHEGYRAIQALPGIGPVLGAVIVAEIGDIRRFPRPGQLCSWAGLTPRHRESDTKVSRGHVTKQGSRMLRWAVTEAIQRQPAGTRPRQVKDGIIARRGTQARNTAKVAAARELLTLIFYGMRDGHIRRASRRGQAA